MYETYVCARRLEGSYPVFDKISELGEEYGDTTCRPRPCNLMNVQLLEKASKINGVTDLVINKVDSLYMQVFQVGIDTTVFVSLGFRLLFQKRTENDKLNIDTKLFSLMFGYHF